jgi:hypothetical protein
MADEVRAAWKEAGRDGKPQLLALGFFCLGPDAAARSEKFLRDYYSFAPFVDALVATAATTEERVADVVRGYTEAGCEELLLFPCASDVEQLELLAAAVK